MLCVLINKVFSLIKLNRVLLRCMKFLSQSGVIVNLRGDSIKFGLKYSLDLQVVRCANLWRSFSVNQ